MKLPFKNRRAETGLVGHKNTNSHSYSSKVDSSHPTGVIYVSLRTCNKSMFLGFSLKNIYTPHSHFHFLKHASLSK